MKPVRSTDAIYPALTTAFENAKQPLTCADLCDIPEVRAAAVNRWGTDMKTVSEQVSNVLGFLWRKSRVDRFMAPPLPGSRALWAYASKGRFLDYDTPVEYKKPERTKNTGDIEIIEKDGEVIISLKTVTIVIRPK